MQDPQLLPLSPPHDTNTPIENIIVKDVPDNSGQNINPLTVENLKKILDQSTLQTQLCNNPILVSVDELQKVVANIIRDKVNTQEPPSTIPLATSDQPLIQTLVDLVEQKQAEEEKTIEEKIGQIDASIPKAHEQGAIQIIVIDKRIFVERKDIPKEKEQESIQALVTLHIKHSYKDPSKAQH